jgi:hypothetical protein
MTTEQRLAFARADLEAELAAKLELTAERYDPATPVWRKDYILVHSYAAADANIADAQAQVDRLERLMAYEAMPVAA